MMMNDSFGSGEDSEGDYSDDESEHMDWNEDSSSAISEGGYKFKKLNGEHLKLENSYLKKIADVLQEGLDGTTNFIAEDEFRTSDISVKVENVGKLSFPLKDSCIKKLISISTKACFGEGEETILNEDVRDTHQIPGEKLNVTFYQFSLADMLKRLRSKIAITKDCSLEVELHNMLIYGPGQFFDLHQDSEKATNMIGTLVIILPSPHIGGNLVIQHGTKEHIFVSENLASKRFKCICFYADCKHKIEKVREGYRVALTYKVILRRDEITLPRRVNQSLKIALQNYFTNLQTNESSTPPKLVFFLDHSYSEHSLRWHLLKGEDQINGDVLRTTGKELDLIAYLVLVEIHHTWMNGDDYQTSRIVDIMLDGVDYTLSHWINSDNEINPLGKCTVRRQEVCWTKETSASFKPKETECRGFTGNEGLSLEYWYHRAAVVLWPPSSEVQMKFKMDHKKALQELQAAISSPGQEKEVKQTVKTAGKYLYHGLCDKAGFDILVRIALYIKDRDVSMSLLSFLKWTVLNCDISKGLQKLESQYGVDWCIDLLNKWKYEEFPDIPYYLAKADKVLKKISSFVANYQQSGGSEQIAKFILEEQVSQISSKEEPAKRMPSTKLKELLKERMQVIYEFFLSCSLIQNTELPKKIIEYIASVAPLYPESDLADVYFKLKGVEPSISVAVCEPLKVYLQKTIGAIMARGMKAKKDWSMTEKLYCECSICKRIETFFLSKTEMKKAWKMLKKERDHVIYEFSWLTDLPVSVSNEKQLILVKTDRLHKDAHKKYAQLKQYLKRLDSQE